MDYLTRRGFFKLSAAGTAAMTTGAGLLASGCGEQSSNADLDLPTKSKVIASNLCSRMDVTPPSARRESIEGLILALLVNGIWQKLDGLYVLAAHHIQAARINWSGCMPDLTSVNQPAFESDHGFAGDGATAFLDTNASALTLANYRAENATMGIYTADKARQDDGFCIGFRGANLRISRRENSVEARTNYISGELLKAQWSGGGAGMTSWSRDSTTASVYHSGRKLAKRSVPPGTIADYPVTILQVGTSYSMAQVSAAVFGSALSDFEHMHLNLALTRYLEANTADAQG